MVIPTPIPDGYSPITFKVDLNNYNEIVLEAIRQSVEEKDFFKWTNGHMYRTSYHDMRDPVSASSNNLGGLSRLTF